MCLNTKPVQRSSLFWDVTDCRFVVIYRRFGTIYPSDLKGSLSAKELWKMGPIGCLETSVSNAVPCVTFQKVEDFPYI